LFSRKYFISYSDSFKLESEEYYILIIKDLSAEALVLLVDILISDKINYYVSLKRKYKKRNENTLNQYMMILNW